MDFNWYFKNCLIKCVDPAAGELKDFVQNNIFEITRAFSARCIHHDLYFDHILTEHQKQPLNDLKLRLLG